jgi:hypothetical protein
MEDSGSAASYVKTVVSKGEIPGEARMGGRGADASILASIPDASNALE